MFQRNRYAEHRIAVSKVGGAIQRVNIPEEVASGFVAAALFSHHVMRWPLLADTRKNQLFRAAVGLGDQVNVTFVFDSYFAEVRHQQRTGLTGQFMQGCEIVLPKAHVRERRPLSSAIYMISCLKINRLGAFSRVRRIMARS